MQGGAEGGHDEAVPTFACPQSDPCPFPLFSSQSQATAILFTMARSSWAPLVLLGLLLAATAASASPGGWRRQPVLQACRRCLGVQEEGAGGQQPVGAASTPKRVDLRPCSHTPCRRQGPPAGLPRLVQR